MRNISGILDFFAETGILLTEGLCCEIKKLYFEDSVLTNR